MLSSSWPLFVAPRPLNLTASRAQCTYCKTKHARGELASYPVAELVARLRAVLAEGVVEIWLTSEDTGAYGRDLGTDLPTLLRALLAELPPNARLRLGMTNPPYILEHLDAMAALLQHPQMYAFLHVPVQSASDEVRSGVGVAVGARAAGAAVGGKVDLSACVWGRVLAGARAGEGPRVG